VWSPPDPYEPTSELYRLTSPRRPDDDPIVVISPETPWWRRLAAKAKPGSRRALGWVWGVVGGALAAVIGSLVYGWLSGH
jgi:hypothetical protein